MLSPYVLGARRIAALLTTLHALEFFDHAMGASEDGEIRIDEIAVRPGSRLEGNSLTSLGVRRDLGVIVMGISRPGGKFLFNPAADLEFQAEDILIGIGSEEQLERFRDLVS